MDLKNRVIEKYLELVKSMRTFEEINKNKPNYFHPTPHTQQQKPPLLPSPTIPTFKENSSSRLGREYLKNINF